MGASGEMSGPVCDYPAGLRMFNKDCEFDANTKDAESQRRANLICANESDVAITGFGLPKCVSSEPQGIRSVVSLHH